MADLDTFEAEACSNEAKQNAPVSSTINDSDIFSLTGSKMRNFLPQIFHLFTLQAHRATEDPDGLQIPEQWVVMIEALPLLSERYYFHLF